jgi:hypothetical protein
MAQTVDVGQPGDTAERGDLTSSHESLSQFVARVLDQLSLSAWLPSAALVLSVGFVVELAAVLDQGAPPASASQSLGQAVGRMTQVTLGGAVLVVALVVVLTMVTQAFAFEAIRVVEGYWGTGRAVERLADLCCRWQRARRRRLAGRERDLGEQAWWSARRALEDREVRRRTAGEPPDLTPDMVEVLAAAVLGREPLVRVQDPGQHRKALFFPWQTYASPELVRRMVNVRKALRDFPSGERVLPTRLGCVLRHHEDRTGEREPESFVQRVWDGLPSSLQLAHDEQRTRLDLYCSMVFVAGVVGTFAVARLWHHPGYPIAAAVIAAAAVWLSYRASVASARAYGGVLVMIAETVRRLQTQA